MRWLGRIMVVTVFGLVPGPHAQAQSTDEISMAFVAGQAVLKDFSGGEPIMLFTEHDAKLVRAVAARLKLSAEPNDALIACSATARGHVCRMPERTVALRLVRVNRSADSALVLYEFVSPAPPPMHLHHQFRAVQLVRQDGKWVVTGRAPTPVH